MPNGPATPPDSQPKVVVVSADASFADAVRTTFGVSAQVGLAVVAERPSACVAQLDIADATVVVVDIEAGDDAECAALESLTGRGEAAPPLIAIAERCDAGLARRLMQMQVADFLVKPVPPVELVRSCARVAKASRRQAAAVAEAATTEAEIFTFLPAVGGAGVTTLAVQTAMLLLNSGPHGRTATCLVDLDFQHGTCADYLDIEPRLNLNEIEPRPERLDQQLLGVMISQHPSGLAVIAAPNRPAEMRSFDPDVVTRLLDLAASHFDYVVIDMPRTWFSWTDAVLLGSNRLFVVSETTVPGLRQARQLVNAIRERLGDSPRPRVLINRFVQKLLSSGLRRSDIEQAIGDAFLACIPNDYALVREAIDRGVPLDEVKKGNRITLELKKLIVPQAKVAKPGAANKSALSATLKSTLNWARS